MGNRPNANEGADPADEIRKQNPGETTTADLAGDAEPNGGQPPEEVEDRPSVGTVRPEEYPEDQRRAQRP